MAQIELKAGIKLRNNPALLAPINDTPLFQQKNAKIPANIPTYTIKK